MKCGWTGFVYKVHSKNLLFLWTMWINLGITLYFGGKIHSVAIFCDFFPRYIHALLWKNKQAIFTRKR